MRTRRIAELIRRELSALIAREVDDRRVKMASVTAVTISKDLKQATVYVSSIDQSVSPVETYRVAREYSVSTPIAGRPIATVNTATINTRPNNNFFIGNFPTSEMKGGLYSAGVGRMPAHGVRAAKIHCPGWCNRVQFQTETVFAPRLTTVRRIAMHAYTMKRSQNTSRVRSHKQQGALCEPDA